VNNFGIYTFTKKARIGKHETAKKEKKKRVKKKEGRAAYFL